MRLGDCFQFSTLWKAMVVTAAFSTRIFTYGIAWSSGVMFMVLLDEFGASKGETSWVSSVLTACYYGSSPVSSIFINWFGPRVVLFAGGVIACLGLVLSYWANGLVCLVITYGVITGCGFGLCLIPCSVMVSRYFSRHRNAAMGVASSGGGVGSFAFPPLLFILYEYFGWRGCMLISGALSANICVCAAVMWPTDLVVSSSPRGVSDDSTGDKAEPEKQPLTPAVEDNTTASCEKLAIEGPEKIAIDALGPEKVPLESRPQHPSLLRLKTEGSAKSPWGQKEKLRTKQDNKKLLTGSHPNLHGAKTLPHSSTHIAGKQSEHLTQSDSHLAKSKKGDSSKALIDQDVEGGKQHHLLNLPPVNASNFFISSEDLFVVNSFRKRAVSTQSKPHDWDKNGSVGLFNHFRQRTNTWQSRHSEADAKNGVCEKIIDEQEEEDGECEKSKSCCLSGAIPCRWSVLKHPGYLIFCLNNFLYTFGVSVVMVHIGAYATITHGIPREKTQLMFSFLGGVGLVGKLILGVIANNPKIGGFPPYTVLFTFGGIITIVLPWFTTYSAIMTYTFLFGISNSAFGGALQPAILVEFFDVETLNDSYGLLLLFCAIGQLIGAPAAGWMYDYTGSYTSSFYLGGVMMLVSGLIMIYPWVVVRRKAKAAEASPEPAENDL